MHLPSSGRKAILSDMPRGVLMALRFGVFPAATEALFTKARSHGNERDGFVANC